MKKSFLALAMAALMCGCAAESSKLHVKMNLKNAGDTIAVVKGGQGEDMPKFTGKDGVFEFDIDIDTAMSVYLVEPQVLAGQPGGMYQVPAVPGEEMTITDEGEGRYDITGSKFYTQFHEADIAIEKAGEELNQFTKSLQEQLEAGASQDSLMKVYEAQAPAMRQKVEDTITDFIKAHSDWEASAAIISQLQDLDKMKAAVELLDKSVREGRCRFLFEKPIQQMEDYKKKEEESAKKQTTGTEAPDFELQDINGKPLKLSSLRGKYVILDFWGSWCGWCIKGFPEMKNYYKKYAGKFEILGIDCNDSEEKWKKAVKDNELPWLHVYCPKESTVLEDYGVSGFPTKIVIGPDGKIVKSIVGEDPAFYTLLDELFK